LLERKIGGKKSKIGASLSKNQPQFSQTTMGQYWLGKTNSKQAFISTRNAFKKLLWNSLKTI